MTTVEFYGEELVTNSYTCTYNYTDDEGRRERSRVPVREKKGREEHVEKKEKKRESHKAREEDERAAKASVGRHAEGAERRNNKCQNNDLPVAGRTNCRPSSTKIAMPEFEIDEFCLCGRTPNTLYLLQTKNNPEKKIFIPNPLQAPT